MTSLGAVHEMVRVVCSGNPHLWESPPLQSTQSLVSSETLLDSILVTRPSVNDRP